MSETKFTQGEWFVEESDNLAAFDIVDEKGNSIADIYGYDPDNTGFNISKEIEANVHLIAAAPEMYNQLAELQLMMESLFAQSARNVFYETALNIEHLLAKARGEQ